MPQASLHGDVQTLCFIKLIWTDYPLSKTFILYYDNSSCSNMNPKLTEMTKKKGRKNRDV